jgi:hypothetical protein
MQRNGKKRDKRQTNQSLWQRQKCQETGFFRFGLFVFLFDMGFLQKQFVMAFLFLNSPC